MTLVNKKPADKRQALMTEAVPEVDKGDPSLSQSAPDANSMSSGFRLIEADSKSKAFRNR